MIRSLLFTPANRPDLYAKALASEADAVCFDLEDSVPALERPDARACLSTWLGSQLPNKRVWIRPGSTVDPEAFVGLWRSRHFRGFIVPKLHYAGQLWRFSRELNLPLLAIIETPEAVERASEIVQHPSVVGAIFGVADLAAKLGILGTDQDQNRRFLYAKQRMLYAAKTVGRLAIDGVYLGPEMHYAAMQWRETASWGFDGACVLNPKQAVAANNCFTPDVEQARRLLATRGNGEARRDKYGVICGEPVYRAARAVLERAGEKE